MRGGRNFRLRRGGPVGEAGRTVAQHEELALFNLDELELDEEADDALFDLEQTENVTADEETLKEVAEQTTYGTVFLDDLIRRQRALSLSVAVVFLVVVFSLPLIAFLAPSLLAFNLFGFDMGWLVLGILIYPAIWGLSFYFVSTAEKYEEDFTKMVK